jgi:lipopolysaccharide/colanic/teichoic acid biosynthesis glycosyltransferase
LPALVERGKSKGRRNVKRLIDMTAGAILVVTTMPLVMVLAVALAIELRCWPFFLQDRIGRGGTPIRFVKLRTLRPDTPAYQLKHDADWDLSRFRAWLRASHLDELPQLWLVLTGRMSLVGPRPRMPDDYEPVDGRYAAMRQQIPQGCTGLWQISVHAGLLPHETPMYDLFYVRHRTVRLDLWVLYRTALLMVGLAQPVPLDAVPLWCRRREHRELVPEMELA